MKAKTTVIGLAILLAASQQALSWGDHGHRAIALIAKQCLTPSAKNQVDAMLAADTDPLTKHDIASESTWADKYREENNRKDHYAQTQNWHYTDMEIDDPNLTTACFGREPLPAGTLASKGPPKACAVDKIEQFEAELSAPNTDAGERLFALKFILHLVGDIHQPLHSSDNHDRGGNSVKVIVDGSPHKSKDNLHGFWDKQFVDAVGNRPATLAKDLLAQITPTDASMWSTGSPEDWQLEAFNLAKSDTYGNPSLSQGTPQRLNADYVDTAEVDVRLQLMRAGIRLAYVLNRSLGTEETDWSACLRSSR